MTTEQIMALEGEELDRAVTELMEPMPEPVSALLAVQPDVRPSKKQVSPS